MYDPEELKQVWRRQGAQAVAEREGWSPYEAAMHLTPLRIRPLVGPEIPRPLRFLGEPGWWKDPKTEIMQAVCTRAVVLEAMTPEDHHRTRQAMGRSLQYAWQKKGMGARSSVEEREAAKTLDQTLAVLHPGRAAPLEYTLLESAQVMANRLGDPALGGEVMAFHLAVRLEEGVAERNLGRLEQRGMAKFAPVLEEVRGMRAIPTLWRMVERQSWDPEDRQVEVTKANWDEALTKMEAHDRPTDLRRAVEQGREATRLDDPRLVRANEAFLTTPRIFEQAPLEALMVATAEFARVEREGYLAKTRSRDRDQAPSR
jgi:hypothetical protein